MAEMEDAMPPQGAPVPSPEDEAAAAAGGLADWQIAIVAPVANLLGLPQGTVLFVLALFASLPIGLVFQVIPSPTAKNAYSLVTGGVPPFTAVKLNRATTPH